MIYMGLWSWFFPTFSSNPGFQTDAWNKAVFRFRCRIAPFQGTKAPALGCLSLFGGWRLWVGKGQRAVAGHGTGCEGGRGVMADRCKEMMKIYNRWYMIYNSVILGSIICWMVFFLEEFWRWHDRCSFSGRKELSNLSQNMARQPVKEPPPWCVCEQALKVGNMRQFCMMKQVAPLVAFYKTMIYIILHPKAANWFSKNWGTLPQLPQKHHWMRQRNVVLRATSAWAAAR